MPFYNINNSSRVQPRCSFNKFTSTAKKPVVLALNRGHHSSKTRRMVEWCMCIAPLEPFFKDNSRLEAAGIEL
jgi:hypothetical protein